MSDDNGDLTGKDSAVVTEEGPSGMPSRATVPAADKEIAKVSGARGVLQNHPWKIAVILLAVLLAAGDFIFNGFRYENKNEAQMGCDIIALSQAVNRNGVEIPA